MALLTRNTIAFGGLDTSAVYVAAAASQEFANDGRVFIHVKNTGASMTCTLTTAGTVGTHAIADTVVTIGATTGEQMIGPFLPSVYNAADGNIDITWSRTSDVTVAVFRLP